ncbi:hypothetical protein JOF29_002082 [Kribbella aluminosa]|uniref:Uncharacterized protein n=1 Tax=Kribbella aluminosa TaxID=416017 RepID=A0ABS4UH93_9ACTN|nr:hypothetical protein [Kribbella aluminosa]MBP2350999.1 hypothetical protein [Kribbella aluminosa]
MSEPQSTPETPAPVPPPSPVDELMKPLTKHAPRNPLRSAWTQLRNLVRRDKA